MSAIAEIDKEALTRWRKGKKLFEKDAGKYLLSDDPDRRRVAGVVRSFADGEFDHSDVVRWGAFAGVDLSERDVSSALSQLQEKPGTPVKQVKTGGSGARWKVNREAMEKYLT
ncbi:MAG: hypothetical protein IIB60_02605 [Planctomycetes bacterium]|nr:hypothetical protein [Planctomycetota bacterium]